MSSPAHPAERRQSHRNTRPGAARAVPGRSHQSSASLCPSRGEWTYGIRPVRKAPGKASRTGFSEPWPPKGHSLFRGVFQMEKTVWLAAAGAFVLALLFWRAYSGTDLGLLAAFFTIVGDLLALLALAKGSDAEA